LWSEMCPWEREPTSIAIPLNMDLQRLALKALVGDNCSIQAQWRRDSLGLGPPKEGRWCSDLQREEPSTSESQKHDESATELK
jgi:hypothetical protein